MFSPPVDTGGATYDAEIVVSEETLGVAEDARTDEDADGDEDEDAPLSSCSASCSLGA